MRTSTIALTLLLTVPLTGCGNDALTPLPIRAASAQPATAPTTVPPRAVPTTSPAPPRGVPPATPAAPARTTTRPPPRPTASSTRTPPPSSSAPATCYGAVRHTIDLQNTELAAQRSMCFQAGGELRLQGIGPGLVTATPESLVDQNYAGGVVDLRFLRPGTVTVTIPQETETYTIEVVVIR